MAEERKGCYEEQKKQWITLNSLNPICLNCEKRVWELAMIQVRDLDSFEQLAISRGRKEERERIEKEIRISIKRFDNDRDSNTGLNYALGLEEALKIVNGGISK